MEAALFGIQTFLGLDRQKLIVELAKYRGAEKIGDLRFC